MGRDTVKYPSDRRSYTPVLAVFLLTVQVIVVAGPAGAGPAPSLARNGTVTFTNVSSLSGLAGLTGNFFSWGDVDGDGHQDLLIDGKRLMRNSGPPRFMFEDITSAAMLNSRVNSGVFADFDNDGLLDIFCGGGSLSNDHPTYPDVLWRNVGGGRFEDATFISGGLSDTFPTAAGGWADFDRNGYVDLYMVNYENATYEGYPDHLWSNLDGRSFVNSSELVHMNDTIPPYQGRGVSWADHNNDGWPDAYVSNYRIMRNFMFQNQKGRTFRESAEELGIEGHASLHPVTRDGPYYGHSLGSSWGDLDNDGDLDLWVTNLAHKDPWRGPICDDSYLFENLGPEGDFAFEDRREGSGIEVKTVPGSLGGGDELMVSSSLADHDNDGDLDLFIPQIYGDVSYAYSLLYRNDGDLTFTEVGPESGIRIWNTYGSAWCDYNEDGWIDLITGGGTWDPASSSTTGYMVHLFRNDGACSGSSNGWLEVSLEGRSSNRAAIGARVTAMVDKDGDGDHDLSVLREVEGGQGAHGQQNSLNLHFGLGEFDGQVDLEVRWPLGRRTFLHDVKAGSRLHLMEPEDDVTVSIAIEDPEAIEEGAAFDIVVTNTCAHPIDCMEMDISAMMDDGPGTVMEAFEGVLYPGESQRRPVIINGALWGEGAELRVEVSRAFPPLTVGGMAEVRYEGRQNLPPVPVLKGPDRASAGKAVVLSGTSSYDQDGSVVTYLFDPGDGTKEVMTDVPELSHTYIFAGSYLASLSVVDDDGAWSGSPSLHRVTVDEAVTEAPTARIVRISPDIISVGEEVFFEGRGETADGSTIVSYSWTSSLDGGLSNKASFGTTALSPGNHTVRFSVTDTRGTTSLPDTAYIVVLAVEVPEIFISIAIPLNGSTLKGTMKARGTSGPAEIIDHVEVRIDEGPWTRTSGHMLPDWEMIVDISGLEAGEHRLFVRASSGDGLFDETDVTFIVSVSRADVEGSTERETGWVWMAPAVVTVGILALLVPIVVALVLSMRKRPRRSFQGLSEIVETAILLDEGLGGKRI